MLTSEQEDPMNSDRHLRLDHSINQKEKGNQLEIAHQERRVTQSTWQCPVKHATRKLMHSPRKDRMQDSRPNKKDNKEQPKTN